MDALVDELLRVLGENEIEYVRTGYLLDCTCTVNASKVRHRPVCLSCPPCLHVPLRAWHSVWLWVWPQDWNDAGGLFWFPVVLANQIRFRRCSFGSRRRSAAWKA